MENPSVNLQFFRLTPEPRKVTDAKDGRQDINYTEVGFQI